MAHIGQVDDKKLTMELERFRFLRLNTEARSLDTSFVRFAQEETRPARSGSTPCLPDAFGYIPNVLLPTMMATYLGQADPAILPYQTSSLERTAQSTSSQDESGSPTASDTATANPPDQGGPKKAKDAIVPDLVARNHPTGGTLGDDSGSRPASASAFFEVKTCQANPSNYSVDAENQADRRWHASGRNTRASLNG
ncbi:hypothetical protein THAOC_01941 [Thalassiosira oceanica]|uniref:Uncharacterized protein n=1 Tax=Thalassiosira oceanica TaxID=159749 RepID=K0TC62_THAOC|nr:hypothetical protein THAOC_01941 [Thalassiosira oceanica]|eukprot:EJK76303.1 hypothetical protein THAOC_01941 [Thalassiosira oceanica]